MSTFHKNVMVVPNIAIYGKRYLFCILTLFLISGFVVLRFLMIYMQSFDKGTLLGIVIFFPFFVVCLSYLLEILVGGKIIDCSNEKISIKSSFFTKKERNIFLSKSSRLLLQCEESAMFKRCDIFRSRISMPVTPIYYVIKSVPEGEPILRLSEKQVSLKAFDYICQRFPHVDKSIDFGNETSIFKVRKLLWIAVLKNFILFSSIQTSFVSLVLFFFSYGVHSGSYSIHFDLFGKNWEQCKIYIENEHTDGNYVWIQNSKQPQKLKCKVLSNDLPVLSEAAKKKELIDVYISFDKSPELSLSSPNKITNFVLLISLAGSMLFISVTLFYLFFRIRKKLRLEASVIDWETLCPSSGFDG